MSVGTKRSQAKTVRPEPGQFNVVAQMGVGKVSSDLLNYHVNCDATICHGPLHPGPWPDFNPMLERDKRWVDGAHQAVLMGCGAVSGVVMFALLPLVAMFLPLGWALLIVAGLSPFICFGPAPWVIEFVNSKKYFRYACKREEWYFVGFTLLGTPIGSLVCWLML